MSARAKTKTATTMGILLALAPVSGLACAGARQAPGTLAERQGGESALYRAAEADADRARERLQRMLDRYAGYGASAVVAWSFGGSTPRVAAAGARDSLGAEPLRASTLFELGSLTKHLTAAAVLRLHQRGLLAPEDSLGRFVADLPAPQRSITLHQLLTHTSGLPEDVDVPRDDPAAVWDRLREVSPEAEPGMSWEYSNFGYVVLAALVERLSGRPYRQFVEVELLEPTAIPDIGFPRLHDWPAERLAVGASGPLGTGRVTRRWPARDRGWDERLGASGAAGSMPALHDWFRALAAGRVLSDSATALMFEEHPPEIAYGWFYVRAGEAVAVAHGGDTEGTQTYLRWRPDLDFVLALGINDRRGWRGPILRDLLTILERRSMPDLPPPVEPIPADSLQALAGTWRIDSETLALEAEEGALRAEARGPAGVALLTGADSALASELRRRSEDAGRFLRALLAGDSAAVGTTLAEEGRPESFWRIWEALGADHPGPARRFEILGTVPGRAGRAVTFVRVGFESGEETLRLVWRPHLAGWGTGGDLPSRRFWPAGEGRFVSYDPTRAGWVTLWIEPGTEGAAALRDVHGRRAVRAG